MYVLRDHRNGGHVSFILPPKTGSRSVEAALRGLGGKVYAGRHGVDTFLLEGSNVSYATVRNPYDVLVSWYHYEPRGARTKTTFRAYLDGLDKRKNGHLEHSVLHFAECAGKFLRYEDGLEAQLNLALDAAGYDPVTLNVIGQAVNRKPWPTYYSDYEYGWVKRRFGSEFARFNYELQGAQCQVAAE